MGALLVVFYVREIHTCYSTVFSSPLRVDTVTQTRFMERSKIWLFWSPRVCESGSWVLYPSMEKMSLSLFLFDFLLYSIFISRSYIKDSIYTLSIIT